MSQCLGTVGQGAAIAFTSRVLGEAGIETQPASLLRCVAVRSCNYWGRPDGKLQLAT